jgi:transposase-like protein
MATQEFSFAKIVKAASSEGEAYRLLEDLRWKGEPVCPHCGSVRRDHYFLTPANGTSRKTRTGKLSERRVWKCKDCRKQFTVLVGTIFHGSKIDVQTWLLVIFDVCCAKNGISAREVERKYGLTPKTAWFMLHRIREAMKRDPLTSLLYGTVMADETWIGGDPKNRHRSDPREQNRQPGETLKQPVMALVDYETREVRAVAIPNIGGEALREVIESEVEMGRTMLWTDEAKTYNPIGRDMRGHKNVNHSQGEYVSMTGVTTNPVEGFFSQLKRSIDGTHHHVSVEHLDRYLDQFSFMYTYCRQSDSQRMRKLIDRAGGRRLSYRPLVGADD